MLITALSWIRNIFVVIGFAYLIVTFIPGFSGWYILVSLLLFSIAGGLTYGILWMNSHRHLWDHVVINQHAPVAPAVSWEDKILRILTVLFVSLGISFAVIYGFKFYINHGKTADQIHKETMGELNIQCGSWFSSCKTDEPPKTTDKKPTTDKPASSPDSKKEKEDGKVVEGVDEGYVFEKKLPPGFQDTLSAPIKITSNGGRTSLVVGKCYEGSVKNSGKDVLNYSFTICPEKEAGKAEML